ncbi:DNA-binding MarR family transcriptional regulator [Murinocardiopsis flavida]|uniref:DNA-binding MarR family transcriptional regulator n=1 Tax=Murinocardiopsis flavida TaxID=645275 RepID=A0A2P8DQ69_9ACTN|nr:MarR family transcriptional regulator [Murinocardiopsis flavida]PSK99376.1 DNA-binding MarR family transcriptional regulator [Murinocardiopsis flavida]
MTDENPPGQRRIPDPELIKETLGYVPLIEAYFRKGPVEMPPELREIFAGHRLTARHGAVISQLVAVTSLNVTELARRMGVSLPTASELVGDLDRSGLIERRPDPENRRRTLVAISVAKRPTVEAFVETRAAPLLRVIESLSPRDRAGFTAGLAAWAHEVRDL